MKRVLRLDLAYDGTGFRGWARQRGDVRTVEGLLTETLSLVLGNPPRLSVAGRTDAGVHARGQVVSFEAEAAVDPVGLARRLNSMLGPEVAVWRARWAPAGFDARLGATAREYIYRVNVSEVADPFDARFVWHRPKPVSLRAMRAAAAQLAGKHDFASFCRTPTDGGSTVRDLRVLAVRRIANRVEIRAAAEGFLHQMVRSLAGTVLAVGEGRMDAGSMRDVLAARDRAAAWEMAPAHGLTLERVTYGRPSAQEGARGGR